KLWEGVTVGHAVYAHVICTVCSSYRKNIEKCHEERSIHLKKLVSIFLALALIVTLIPVYGPASQVDAAGSFFIFPNEKDDKTSARIVSTKYVNLSGTINGVVGSSISYKVEQVTLNSDTPLNSTE